MTTKSDNPADVGVHVFEKAGLGKGPFRCIGFEHKVYRAHPDAPAQVGGSCMYCGTGISLFCYIKGVDGKVFHVGSDCVAKTGDAGLIRSYKNHPQVRAAAKAKRVAKAAKVQAEITALMTNPAIKAGLEAQRAERGSSPTLYGYFEFVFRACGDAGKARWLKVLKAKIAQYGITASVIVDVVIQVNPTVTMHP